MASEHRRCERSLTHAVQHRQHLHREPPNTNCHARSLTTLTKASTHHQPSLGALAVFVALLSQYLGAAYAKHLFAVVGPAGMTALRVALAALLLLGLTRPSRPAMSRAQAVDVACYGAMLGLMNLLIYEAIARIPIGIAVAIEVLGPLAVVLAGTRRLLDLVWLAAAVAGLALLLPWRVSTAALDPLGLACAVGAAFAWAMYIVFGKRVAAGATADAVFWGMLVAAVLVVPVGLAEAGTALLTPSLLAVGLAVAALSSALPYSLEMFALARLPTRAFGVMVSASPAAAALVSYLTLGEQLSRGQWLAIVLIMFAVAGSTVTDGKGGSRR